MKETTYFEENAKEENVMSDMDRLALELQEQNMREVKAYERRYPPKPYCRPERT